MYLTMLGSTIYKTSGFVKLFAEIRAFYARIVCYVYLAPEQILKSELEVEKVVRRFEERDIIPIEVNAEVHVALVVEAVGENRAENP